MTSSLLVDPLLALEARLVLLEDRLSVAVRETDRLAREVRRLRDDRDHWRRRVAAADAVLARHNPAHGHRVLLQHLSYVLGAHRDHTNHRQGDQL